MNDSCGNAHTSHISLFVHHCDIADALSFVCCAFHLKQTVLGNIIQHNGRSLFVSILQKCRDVGPDNPSQQTTECPCFFFLELFLVISNQQDLDLKDCICVQLWLHYTNHIQGKGLLMIQNTTLSGDWKSIILRCFYDFSFVLFFSERTT